MKVVNCRLCLLVLAIAAAPLQEALPQVREAPPQARQIQGAWLEEGSACADVFVATQDAVAFKRPANAFAPAFIVSGRRLSTPLASCRLAGVARSGERHVLRLSCTTTVSTDSAQAVFSLAEDGNLNRYHAVEGGIATRYQRCTRDALKAPRDR